MEMPLLLEDWIFLSDGLAPYICDDSDQDIKVVMADLEQIVEFIQSPNSTTPPDFVPFDIHYQGQRLTILSPRSLCALAVSDGVLHSSNDYWQESISIMNQLWTQLDDDVYTFFLYSLIASDPVQAAILLIEAGITSCPFCKQDESCDIQEAMNSTRSDLLHDAFNPILENTHFSLN